MSEKRRNTVRMPTRASAATCCAVGSSTPSPTSRSSASTIARPLRWLRRTRPSGAVACRECFAGLGVAIGDVVAY